MDVTYEQVRDALRIAAHEHPGVYHHRDSGGEDTCVYLTPGDGEPSCLVGQTTRFVEWDPDILVKMEDNDSAASIFLDRVPLPAYNLLVCAQRLQDQQRVGWAVVVPIAELVATTLGDRPILDVSLRDWSEATVEVEVTAGTESGRQLEVRWDVPARTGEVTWTDR